MKTINKTLIVSLAAGFALLGSVMSASADTTPSLIVSQGYATQAQGKAFTTNVVVATDATNPVYAIEGTLSFSNLSCKGISPVEGIMIQSMPTCANPYFMAGIPGGAKANTSLFMVTVAGAVEGQAVLGITSADVIGNGVSLSNQSVAATYTITPGLAPAEVASTTPTGEVLPGGEAGEGATTTEATTTATSTATSTNDLLAAVGNTLYDIPSASVLVLGVLLIALLLGLIYYRRIKRQA